MKTLSAILTDPATWAAPPTAAVVLPRVLLVPKLQLNAISRPGPGFFRRIVGDEVQCWPCGDLVCDPVLQRQTPTCDRFDDEAEPTCACGPPPAAVASSTACSFQCNAGYQPSGAPAASFVEHVGFMKPFLLKTYAHVAPCASSQSVGVQGEGFSVCDDGNTA